MGRHPSSDCIPQISGLCCAGRYQITCCWYKLPLILPEQYKGIYPGLSWETELWVLCAWLNFISLKKEIKQKKARGYFMACLNLEDGILRLGHCTKMKGKKILLIILFHTSHCDCIRILSSHGFMVTLREIKKSWFYVLPFNSLRFLNSKVVTNVKWVLEGRHFTTRQLSLVILHLQINTETWRPFPYWYLNCSFHSSFLM